MKLVSVLTLSVTTFFLSNIPKLQADDKALFLAGFQEESLQYFRSFPINKRTERNLSFTGYQECIAALTEQIGLQQQIEFSAPEADLEIPHIQPKIDLWLVPWSDTSSIIGYLPGAKQSPVNQAPAPSRAWTAGWPVLPKRPPFQGSCGNGGEVRSQWDAVYAIKRGEVLAIGKNSANNHYGTYILLQHQDEAGTPVTLYAHLAGIAEGLQVGSRVGQGQRIAQMGATGRGAAGKAHLHLSYFSSIERILDEDGLLPPNNIGILYRQAQNPVYFIAEGAYPTNTYIGNLHSSVYEPSYFNQWYRRFRRYHEGIDFSGSRWQLLDNWQQGVAGSEVVAQYRAKADLVQESWLYELNRR